MKENVDLATGFITASAFTVGSGGGDDFLAVGIVAVVVVVVVVIGVAVAVADATADVAIAFSFAAAARAAFDVPGFLGADRRPENGLGVNFAWTAAAAVGFEKPAGPPLNVPLTTGPAGLDLFETISTFFRSAFCSASGFEACLMVLEATTRFVAGRPARRGRAVA